MIAPIKLRSEEILRSARQALRQYRHDQIMRRRVKLLGVKALLAAERAFAAQEEAFARLSDVNQKDWPERRQAAESLLREIARGLT
jgi:hypothetical protein